MHKRERPFPPHSEGAVFAATALERASHRSGWPQRHPQPTGTSSLEHLPGDSYSNIRKLSEGLQRLTGAWERDRQGKSEVVAIGGEHLPSSPGAGCSFRRTGISTRPEALPLNSSLVQLFQCRGTNLLLSEPSKSGILDYRILFWG